MRIIGLLLMTILIGAACCFGFAGAFAGLPSDPPEFYFTRLAYSERPDGCCRHRGGFGFGFGFSRPTMPIPPQQFICPEFGGGRFFPPQGWGWGTDYPGGDCKFMGGIHRLTGLRVNPNPNIIGVMDPSLYGFPYVYAVEVGGMHFDERDAARMREYLLRGGFLHVDDFWGLRERGNFEAQMRKVFPDKTMEVLPLSHPIFHTFFDIDEIMQIPNQGAGCYGGPTWEVQDDTQPRVYGMTDDNGRLMVVATYNADYGDAWEYMDLPCYPERYSSQAYRLGLNVMIYAMSH